MKDSRSITLIETVVGLALLAGLGVWLLKLQAESTRQIQAARLRERAAEYTEALLFAWSSQSAPVTLPASGRFDDQLSWRRQVRPVRVAQGVLPIQVSLIVTLEEPDAESREVYRVAWLVPERRR